MSLSHGSAANASVSSSFENSVALTQKTNVGIQASLGIPGRYWRFFVTPHQQEILERIARVLGNRALVVYAAPVFDTLDELYNLTQSGQIVDRSTFVKVQRMFRHSSWNYNTPGTRGIAESDPEPINEDPLEHIIADLIENYDADGDPRKELEELHKALIYVCKEESDGNPLARYFLHRYELMHETLGGLASPEREVIGHFIGIILFCDSANVLWLPIGPSETE